MTPAINMVAKRPESKIMYKHYTKNHAQSPDSEKLSLQGFLKLVEEKTGSKAKLGYNGYQLNCPSHSDKRASLSVTQDENSKILFHCHAGCQFKDICWTLNIKPQQLFPQSN